MPDDDPDETDDPDEQGFAQTNRPDGAAAANGGGCLKPNLTI